VAAYCRDARREDIAAYPISQLGEKQHEDCKGAIPQLVQKVKGIVEDMPSPVREEHREFLERQARKSGS